MPSQARRGFAAIFVVFLVLAGTAAPASAHTGFESSNPADGQIIDEPVSEILLTFTGEAIPTGDGFVVLDPSGTIRQPDEITSVDNRVWTLRFDEPLDSGVVGVRWKVAAPDAHPIDGSFSFTVSAPPPTTTVAPESTVVEEITTPSIAAATAVDPVEAEPEADAATQATSSEEATSEEGVDSTLSLQAGDGEVVDLDSFLNTGDDTAWGSAWVLRASRVLRNLGAVGAIGGAAFVLFVLRGDQAEIWRAVMWLRRAGALLIVGAVGTATAQLATAGAGWSNAWTPSAWVDLLWSSLGVAILLRFAGGGLVAATTKSDTRIDEAAGDTAVSTKQLISVGSASTPTSPAVAQHSNEATGSDSNHAWQENTSVAALIGVGLVALSFMFDGHTVSEGPRWVHAVANLTHVITAATWAGGVSMLAMVLLQRRRASSPLRSLQLGVRFSVVATVSLVAAGVAGVALSAVILDSFSQLWSTSWGRLLLFKMVLVAVAAAGGAYNHKVVVPALEGSPESSEIADRFRKVVTFEAIALVAVTIVTALLIGASAT